MKQKLIVKLCLLAIGTGAAGANASGNIQCLDAAGFYGNIQVLRMPLGQVQVIAAQGFAYEISTQLGASPNQEVSQYSTIFDSSQCRSMPTGIRCSGATRVQSQKFSQSGSSFNATVEFQLTSTRSEHIANLSIQTQGGTKRGHISHQFKAPLGECRFL